MAGAFLLPGAFAIVSGTILSGVGESVKSTSRGRQEDG
jgi:hypothetical protein